MNTASVTRAFARNASESAYPNLWRGLVAAWLPPGAPKHPTRLIDYSGNGNHGTLQNGTSWDIGKTGRCMNFDGVDDLVIGDTSGKMFPIGSQSRAVSCWLKGGVYSGDVGILHWGTDGNTTPGTNFHLAAGSGGLVLWGNGFGFGMVSSISSWNDNKWHHIAAVYDSTTGLAIIYMDGRLDASQTIATTPNTGTVNNWQLGKFLGGTGYFSGKISHCLLFSRVLKENEIFQLASSISPLQRVSRRSAMKKVSLKSSFFSFSG